MLTWTPLPPLPDPIGFAGMYAGVTSDGVLLAAGGANFPDAPPWQGGMKVWTDAVYGLSDRNKSWRIVGKLPAPMGYGVSVSWDGGVIVIGGSDAQRAVADVLMLRLVDGVLQVETLPPLPGPCTQMCGTLVGSTVYVAGGIDSPDATRALRTFWAMDLAQPASKRAWQTLEPWPGPGRMQAIAGSRDEMFYLFSGIELTADASGKPKRIEPFLRDAYRFDPKAGVWQKLPEMPGAAAAAPSPAMTTGRHLVIAGGIDQPAPGLPSAHPGFFGPLLAYDTAAQAWVQRGRTPQEPLVGVVTAPAVQWASGYVVVSGEKAPGVRTPQVAMATLAYRQPGFGIAAIALLACLLAGLLCGLVAHVRR